MTVHIIGGGIAGISAALALSARGYGIRLYESAPILGGRCRTFRDPALDAEIDNGTHVVMTANSSVMTYLRMIGGRSSLMACPADKIEWYDAADGQRHAIRPGPALNPFWAFQAGRRPAGVSATDLLAALALRWARAGQTADQALKVSTAAKRIVWEPFCTAVLNTPLASTDARLFAANVMRAFVNFATAPVPLFAAKSLHATFIAPALAQLNARGVEIAMPSPVTRIAVAGRWVSALDVHGHTVAVSPADHVICTVPPWTPLIAPLLPEKLRAWPTSAIVNVHYQIDCGNHPRFTGLLGSHGQWILARNGIVAVTASAADQWMESSPDSMVQSWWPDVARALGYPEMPTPPGRVIKERRATLIHAPGLDPLRRNLPQVAGNFTFAGDWTVAGIPATLEAAIHSGFDAASALEA